MTALTEGTKFDQGKLRWDLLPWDALEEVVKVLTFGANKYEDRNWEKGMNYNRPSGAMFRHHVSWFKGEKIDEECQTHHLANLIVEALFLLTYELRGQTEFDNYTRHDPLRSGVVGEGTAELCGAGVQHNIPTTSDDQTRSQLELGFIRS